jgi:hypothetical protein
MVSNVNRGKHLYNWGWMINCEYAECFELAFDNFQLWTARNIVNILLKQLKE